MECNVCVEFRCVHFMRSFDLCAFNRLSLNNVLFLIFIDRFEKMIDCTKRRILGSFYFTYVAFFLRLTSLKVIHLCLRV